MLQTAPNSSWCFPGWRQSQRAKIFAIDILDRKICPDAENINSEKRVLCYHIIAMKIYLETLGCQMNRLDSELITGMLTKAGHEMVDSDRAADVVLYNTCSVRDHAEQKVFSRLGMDSKRKNSGKKLIVGVLGCMAQRQGKKLKSRYKAVDIVCSPGQIYQLVEMIEKARDEAKIADQKRTAAIENAQSQGKKLLQNQLPSSKVVIATDPTRTQERDLDSEARIDVVDATRDPMLTSSPTQAFVRVARGCNKFCSYCIVPYVRGPERSREPMQVLEEVKKLADTGHSEITLVGQTVNSYRHTAGDKTTTFADLLELLSPVAGLKRLRFVTSYPTDFGRDILTQMRDLPNVCEYIHCPPQSGSDNMLKAMNRRYSRAEYDAWLDLCREIVPNVVLAGDFIVGFPGETEADHQASADLIRRAGFKNCFVFKYSPRPGTNSDKKLADSIPDAIKKRRNNELLAVQREMGLIHHQQYIGKTLEVLVTGQSRRSDKQAPTADGKIQLMGRTTGDHIVVFDGSPELVHKYANVKIADANDLTLFGKIS